VCGWSAEQVRQGAREAGRDPNNIDMASATCLYISDDLKHARNLVRWFPRLVSNHVFDALSRYPREQLPPELTKHVDLLKSKYDYRRHTELEAEHLKDVPDEMVDSFTIIGSRRDCVNKIEQLKAAGVTQILVYSGHVEQERLTRRIGEEIISVF